MKAYKRHNKVVVERILQENNIVWTHPSPGIYRVLGLDYYPHAMKCPYKGVWHEFKSHQEFVHWLLSDCKEQHTTMKDPNQQEMARDLSTYKDRIREIKTLLVELEGLIMTDYFQRINKEEPNGGSE